MGSTLPSHAFDALDLSTVFLTMGNESANPDRNALKKSNLHSAFQLHVA